MFLIHFFIGEDFMYDKISKKLISLFVSNDIINEEEKENYRYGL